jgi:hypothetical protein
VVTLLVPAGEPVVVAIDDTLFRRRGKKVWAASWFHDGSAPGPAKTGSGNNWVVAAVIVRLPALSRPAAIPVLAKLVIKSTAPRPGCGWPASSSAPPGGQAASAGPTVTQPPVTRSRPVPTATHQGLCSAGTSAIVRSFGGTSTPSAAPAARASVLRSTCPEVTCRRPLPIQRASTTACRMTAQSTASRATSRSSSEDVTVSTGITYRRREQPRVSGLGSQFDE